MNNEPLSVPSPPSATEKMRAFMRSGRYLTPERLDDYSGDYRSAPLLGPVETADMRHHRERLQSQALPEEQANVPLPAEARAEDMTAPDVLAPPAGDHAVAVSVDRCLHRYARREICRRCLDICASGAIRPGDPIPHVDHALCVGCGDCVGACPTHAIGYLAFSPQALLAQVRERLADHPMQDPAPVVVFILQGTAGPPTDTQAAIVAEVPALGLIAPALLLSTLAMGAAGVRVLLDTAADERLRRRIEVEIEWIRSLLTAWGFDDERIGFWLDDDTVPRADAAGAWRVPPARYPIDQPERLLTLQAVAHLANHALTPGGPVPLPVGTPFGAVRIDESRCTLCMACAGACRQKALEAIGGESPGIGFTESRCVQCGACERVCPEQAVALVPRMNPDLAETEARMPLHQSQPAHCSACDRIFTTRQMIASLERRLRGHWMYADPQAQKRLHMCDRCRVQDLFRQKDPVSVSPKHSPPNLL